MSTREPIPAHALWLEAKDGFRLSADLYLPPDGPPRRAALLAPAMAVPKTFYRQFAGHLARRGIAVLTLDYRGVGGSSPGSLRGFEASFRDWAERDLPAALAHLEAALPGVPRAWIGHSVGGQLFGLTPSPAVDRAVLIAVQNGYWGNWRGLDRLVMGALWYALMPAVIALTGRVPMRALGQGVDLPAAIGRQWILTGRRPNYLRELARSRRGSGFEAFSGEIRAYGFTDDRYAPASAVEALVQDFQAARSEVHLHAPEALGQRKIGHFGFFHRAVGERLWDEIADWLLEAPPLAAGA